MLFGIELRWMSASTFVSKKEKEYLKYGEKMFNIGKKHPQIHFWEKIKKTLFLHIKKSQKPLKTYLQAIFTITLIAILNKLQSIINNKNWRLFAKRLLVFEEALKNMFRLQRVDWGKWEKIWRFWCSSEWFFMWFLLYPASIYLFKANNRNTRTMCEICSKLTIKTPERRRWRRSGIFIVNFEQIFHIVLVFLLLTLSQLMPTLKLILISEANWKLHFPFRISYKKQPSWNSLVQSQQWKH